MQLVQEKEILPILVTQSSLYGDSIDPVTGIDLSRILLNDIPGLHKYNLD